MVIDWGQHQVLCKILFGSKMLKLDNPRDEDWIMFTDKVERQEGLHRICFENKVIQSFIDGRNEPTDYFKVICLYQRCGAFHSEENYPFKHFDILQHKKVWIKQLQGYMSTIQPEEKEILDKYYYHILYQYYMIVENTYWISEAAKEQVQKIHDYQMPSEFFYQLRDMINNL